MIIDHSSLKSTLNELTDEKTESILQLIKYSVKMETEKVEEYINNAMKKMDSKPTSMNEMAEALKEYEQIRQSE